MGQPQPQALAGLAAERSAASGGHPVDDAEWEYEYHESDREDLYFTLDLTTHVPDALARKYDPTTQTYESPRYDEHNGIATTEEGLTDHAAVHSRPRNALQILDLHTRNPLVRFDDGIYSCYWTTDLGTQFHVAQAGATPGPRRAGTVLDVIGLSQTRLIGKPVTLTPKNFPVDATARDAPPEKETVEVQSNDGDAAHEEAPRTPGTSDDPLQPLVIPRKLCKDSTAETQASFLEKLSQIKLKKGETDPVPMFSIRIHRDPANKDELRKRALEADAAQKKDEEAAAADKPRKRRKRLTAVEKGLVADGSRPVGGRKDRETLGARVGFAGQGPGSLVSQRPKKKQKQKQTKEKQMQTQTRNTDESSEEADDDGGVDDEADAATRALAAGESTSDVPMEDPS